MWSMLMVMNLRNRALIKYFKHCLAKYGCESTYLKFRYDLPYKGCVWCRHKNRSVPDKFMIEFCINDLKTNKALDYIKHEIAHILAIKDPKYNQELSAHHELWVKYAKQVGCDYEPHSEVGLELEYNPKMLYSCRKRDMGAWELALDREEVVRKRLLRNIK